MTDFTLIDGVYLMIVAMATVFLILGILTVLLTLVGKVVNKYLPTPAKVPVNAPLVVSVPVEQTDEKTLSPEKVALIMSIIFEQRAQENKIKSEARANEEPI